MKEKEKDKCGKEHKESGGGSKDLLLYSNLTEQLLSVETSDNAVGLYCVCLPFILCSSNSLYYILQNYWSAKI